MADASEWVSSNPEVAEVQSDGTLTAVGAGETKVSLNNAEGEAIYSYTVEVADLKVYYENSVTGEKTKRKGRDGGLYAGSRKNDGMGCAGRGKLE